MFDRPAHDSILWTRGPRASVPHNSSSARHGFVHRYSSSARHAMNTHVGRRNYIGKEEKPTTATVPVCIISPTGRRFLPVKTAHVTRGTTLPGDLFVKQLRPRNRHRLAEARGIRHAQREGGIHRGSGIRNARRQHNPQQLLVEEQHVHLGGDKHGRRTARSSGIRKASTFAGEKRRRTARLPGEE